MRALRHPGVPAGLKAERFVLDGVDHILFTWEPPNSLASLSDGERAVCKLLLEGASNAQIAKARSTSSRTVANQVASVLKKLGVTSRFELIARYAGARDQ